MILCSWKYFYRLLQISTFHVICQLFHGFLIIPTNHLMGRSIFFLFLLFLFCIAINAEYLSTVWHLLSLNNVMMIEIHIESRIMHSLVFTFDKNKSISIYFFSDLFSFDDSSSCFVMKCFLCAMNSICMVNTKFIRCRFVLLQQMEKFHLLSFNFHSQCFIYAVFQFDECTCLLAIFQLKCRHLCEAKIVCVWMHL